MVCTPERVVPNSLPVQAVCAQPGVDFSPRIGRVSSIELETAQHRGSGSQLPHIPRDTTEPATAMGAEGGDRFS